MLARKTKIFLDSGDPQETRKIIEMLGFLDGQTTNPSLIAKNPEVKNRIDKGSKFSRKEIVERYRDVVTEISEFIPHGSVSVEVYANNTTRAEEMCEQGEEMFLWVPNAHIKYPCNWEGLRAGVRSNEKGMRINITLCFSQDHAAAVHVIAVEALKGEVFVSPFVGRLDDKGMNGMNLIKNIIQMYSEQLHRVDVLTASVRSIDHLLYAIYLGSDIVTVPFPVLEEWVRKGMPEPDESYEYPKGDLEEIPYKPNLLAKPLFEYDIFHELTEQGIKRFANDWDMLIKA